MSDDGNQVNRLRSVSLAMAAVGFVVAFPGTAWPKAPAADAASHPPTPAVTRAPSAPAARERIARRLLPAAVGWSRLSARELEPGRWRPGGGVRRWRDFAGGRDRQERPPGPDRRRALAARRRDRSERVLRGDDVRCRCDRPISRRGGGIRRLLPESAARLSPGRQRRTGRRLESRPGVLELHDELGRGALDPLRLRSLLLQPLVCWGACPAGGLPLLDDGSERLVELRTVCFRRSRSRSRSTETGGRFARGRGQLGGRATISTVRHISLRVPQPGRTGAVSALVSYSQVTCTSLSGVIVGGVL